MENASVITWSERLESVRKDVECFFGRLKIRYRIIRNSIQLHKRHQIDQVMIICCILHNMMLHESGLDIQWQNDNPLEREEDDDQDI